MPLDADGNEVTLEHLCRTQPAWAASRIRSMEAALEAAREQLDTTEQYSGSVLRLTTKLHQALTERMDYLAQLREVREVLLKTERERDALAQKREL